MRCPRTANSDAEREALKEEILAELSKRPKIYSDAVKWTLARWSGIGFSSLFKEVKIQAERDKILRELSECDLFRVFSDPKRGSEPIIKVTEKGRNEIIGLFYSKSQQKELKRLFKKFDTAFASKTAPQPKN